MNLRAPATAAAFTPSVVQLGLAPELAALALLEAALAVASAALVAAQPEQLLPGFEPSTDPAEVASRITLRPVCCLLPIANLMEPERRRRRWRDVCSSHDPVDSTHALPLLVVLWTAGGLRWFWARNVRWRPTSFGGLLSPVTSLRWATFSHGLGAPHGCWLLAGGASPSRVRKANCQC